MPSSDNLVNAVIPAAGIGSRMQASIPKQYLMLNGKAILDHTLEHLLACDWIAEIIVALHPDDQWFDQLKHAHNIRVKTVTGGAERSDSVLAGLHAITDKSSWVMVHDAARPNIHLGDLEALRSACFKTGQGGILAAKAKDTIKRAVDSSSDFATVGATEPRHLLWHAMTPQFFPVDMLQSALETAVKQQVAVTDEASAIEFVGGDVLLVEGRTDNIKVTNPEDAALMTFYLTQRQSDCQESK